MNDPEKIYKAKIRKLAAQQKRATTRILYLTEKVQAIEADIEKLGDEEFVRTGIFSWSETYEITLTYNDLLKDLVKKTKGKMIDPQEPNAN